MSALSLVIHSVKLPEFLTNADRDSKLAALLPEPTPTTPQKPKLVLAQNNPHLKSHRRRQSEQLHVEQKGSPQLASMPGQHVPGMEHTKQLADVLYQRWSEGLRNRWPAI